MVGAKLGRVHFLENQASLAELLPSLPRGGGAPLRRPFWIQIETVCLFVNCLFDIVVGRGSGERSIPFSPNLIGIRDRHPTSDKKGTPRRAFLSFNTKFRYGK